MYLKERLTHLQIAKKLGVCRSLVQEDLACLLAQWRHDAKLNTEEHIAIELQTIDENIRWAKEIYEKSRKPLRSATASERQTPDGPETTRSATVVERDGDLGCLSEVRKWEELRCKILGLVGKKNDDKEEKNKPTGTFEEMLAAHFKAQEQNGNGASPKENRLAPIRLDPKRLP